MANKLLNFIVIALLFIFVTLTKFSGFRFRFSLYSVFVLPVVYLWYKFKKQADNLGDWYIDKTVLLILSPVIIFVTAYSYAATEGSNLKIVLIATLNAILISMLFSLYKDKDGDFKVTLTLIKSLSDDVLTQVLNTLEESEQKLIIQRFGLVNGKTLTIAALSSYYSMDTTDLKDWLILVDNKLFKSIKARNVEKRGA
ncbi:MAG: hypothetical protein ACOX0F_03640 [Syntrophomonadaceae bacterium]|jgi:hypothetical protein